MPFNNEESTENPFDHTEMIDVECMDDEEEDSSSQSTTSKGALLLRNPTCALCKNHGVSSALKGHKRYCPFGRCGCELCRVTRRKQKINASQVATRRALQQDRELGIERPPQSSGSSTPKTSPPVVGTDLREPPHPVHMSGPKVHVENLSLVCFLLGRNASLLVNALRDPKLTMEDLTCIDHDVCTAIRIARDEVSVQLNDIYKYLGDRLQREEITNGGSKSNSVAAAPYVANQFAEPRADEFNNAQTYGHSSRETVICPPRILHPMYNQCFNQ